MTLVGDINTICTLMCTLVRGDIPGRSQGGYTSRCEHRRQSALKIVNRVMIRLILAQAGDRRSSVWCVYAYGMGVGTRACAYKYTWCTSTLLRASL